MTEPLFAQDARRYLVMLHRRRVVIATWVVLSLLAALVYNTTTRPLYQATAQILIEPSTPRVLPSADLLEPRTQDYQTEYELLRGQSLAESVVQKLDGSKRGSGPARTR